MTTFVIWQWEDSCRLTVRTPNFRSKKFFSLWGKFFTLISAALHRLNWMVRTIINKDSIPKTTWLQTRPIANPNSPSRNDVKLKYAISGYKLNITYRKASLFSDDIELDIFFTTNIKSFCSPSKKTLFVAVKSAVHITVQWLKLETTMSQ